jgi:hypothetical protein
LGFSREGTDWEHVLEKLVCYRLLDPGSEWRLHRVWFEQSAMGDLLGEDFSIAAKDTFFRCRHIYLFEFTFLNLGHAAIDEQLDACDVAAVVRGEEHGGVRHLVRRAHPAQRYGGDDVRLHLVDLLPRPPPAR